MARLMLGNAVHFDPKERSACSSENGIVTTSTFARDYGDIVIGP